MAKYAIYMLYTLITDEEILIMTIELADKPVAKIKNSSRPMIDWKIAVANILPWLEDINDKNSSKENVITISMLELVSLMNIPLYLVDHMNIYSFKANFENNIIGKGYDVTHGSKGCLNIIRNQCFKPLEIDKDITDEEVNKSKVKKKSPAARKSVYEIELEIKEEKRIRQENAYKEKRIKASMSAERYIVPNVEHIMSLVDKDDIKKRRNKGFDNYVEYKNTIYSYEKTSYIDNPIKRIDVIKKHAESVFDITKVNSKGKSIDFILRLNGMKFKVKHIVSSLRYYHHNNVDIEQYGWSYVIKNNKVADAFLLTAIDNTRSPNYQHLWFIEGREMYKVLQITTDNGKRRIASFSRKMFRHRFLCQIRNEREIISYMDKFELKRELKKIRLLKLDTIYNKNGDIIKSLLYEKQQEIFETKGIKRSIGYLIEEAIRIGFGKRLELYNNIGMDNTSDIVQKMLDARLKKNEAKIVGNPLVDYENDAYNLILEKQKELLDITGELRSIKEIIDEGIESGIDYVL